MSKYILWLDDDPNRTVTFSQRLSDEDRGRTIWATSVKEAKKTLEEYGDVFDEIYLDHDLGEGSSHKDSRSEFSGMEIVRWLENQPKYKYRKAKVTVHSWNISAARRMTSRLEHAGFEVIQKPFGT